MEAVMVLLQLACGIVTGVGIALMVLIPISSFRAKHTLAGIACIALGAGIFMLGTAVHNHLSEKARMNGLIYKEKEMELDRFLSGAPIVKEKAWWIDGYAFLGRDIVENYPHVLKKHFPDFPDKERMKYFDDIIRPFFIKREYVVRQDIPSPLPSTPDK